VEDHAVLVEHQGDSGAAGAESSDASCVQIACLANQASNYLIGVERIAERVRIDEHGADDGQQAVAFTLSERMQALGE
uniref:hypothetical protein n=1 Tax=Caballeronia sp. GaOx3 TaxID=2921740 RepID=UPI002027DA26